MADTTVVLLIEGMTCSSCPPAIECKLKKLDGVKDANVTESTKEGVFTIDKSVISPLAVVAAVTKANEKFTAALKSVDGKEVKVALINIEGMGCGGCVTNITGKMSDKPGVVDVKVSLDDKNAKLAYDPAVTDAAQCVQAICDIDAKFTATLADS